MKIKIFKGSFIVMTLSNISFFKKIVFWSLAVFAIASFSHNPVSANNRPSMADDYTSFLDKEVSSDLWSDFTKSWYYLQVKDLNALHTWKLDLSSFKNLNLTNDGVFKANAKAIEKINQEKEEISKKIDIILDKINTKEQNIDNVESQYRRYIEIENDVNNADYVYVMALPINKFLLKESDSKKYSIVITREAKIWAWSVAHLDQENVDQDLKNIIEREIADINAQPSLALMREKINQYSEKQGRSYSPLYIEKSFEQFFKDITVSIGHKDKKFATMYNYRNKEYMNSFFYLPQKLKQLEEHTDKYLFIYIPLKATNPAVTSVLSGVDSANRARVFKDSADFCFKIDYQDNHQTFNDYFCSLNELFTGWTIKVKNIDMYYLNNYYIVLSKLWFMSVIYQLLILIACSIVPFFFIKYADKIIGFWSKFETEQL